MATHTKTINPDERSPSLAATPAVMARPPAIFAPLVAAASALVLFHHRVIVRAIETAIHDFGGDWSHTLAVPLIAAWLAHRRMDKSIAIAPAPARLALPPLLAGLVAYQLALYPGRNHAAQGVLFVFNLAVCLWFLAGTAALRRMAVPIVFLLLAVRLPEPLIQPITQSLRQLAVNAGSAILGLGSIRSHVQGQLLVLHSSDGFVPIDVADACSGLRSLLAFVTLAAAFAFLNPRPPLHRAGLIASAVPIAVGLNAIRIAALAVLQLRSPAAVNALPHDAAALVLLPLALVALLLLDRAFSRLVVLGLKTAEPPAEETHAPPPVASLRCHAWIIALLFTLAACLQYALLRGTQVILDKRPVALRGPLQTLPPRLGGFTSQGDDPPLSDAAIESLGTRSYLLRTYRRDDLRAVNLHLAYYTGNPDTLPHIPDRCLVAAGAEPIDTRTIRVNDALDATLLLYHPPTQPDRTAAVIYFFIANGRSVADASRVRAIAFDPTRRTSYHCKVELNLPDTADAAQAATLAGEFLRDALPAIMSLLPGDAR